MDLQLLVARGGWGEKTAPAKKVFLFFGFPTLELDTSLKSKSGDRQTKRRGTPPKKVPTRSGYQQQVNQPPANPFKSKTPGLTRLPVTDISHTTPVCLTRLSDRHLAPGGWMMVTRGGKYNSPHCHERARLGEEVQVLNYLHSGSLKANRSKTPTPSFSLHASTQPGSPATHLQLALSRCTLQNRF